MGWRTGLAAAAVWALTATGAASEPRHGLSAFGDLKYPSDFTKFAYVNPEAPKGGRLSTIGTAGLITFNSFNAFILKGDAAQGLNFLFDSLMTRALDEPDAVYGLVAHSAEIAEDRMSVTFFLREEGAREPTFHEAPWPCVAALVVTALGSVLLFVFPEPLLDLIRLVVP